MIGRLMRVAVAGVLVFAVAGTTNAFAKDGDVIKRGSCSGASDWKLKLSPENGKIEVEYEVDSNHAGQTWRVKLFENGNRIFVGTKTTQGASGSFTVRKLAANTAGSDSFRAQARNLAGRRDLRRERVDRLTRLRFQRLTGRVRRPTSPRPVRCSGSAGVRRPRELERVEHVVEVAR